MIWQTREAKQRLSEVIDCALDKGPQVLTRRGKEVAVVLSITEFKRLLRRKPDFKKLLSLMPRVAIRRSTDLPRDVEL